MLQQVKRKVEINKFEHTNKFINAKDSKQAWPEEGRIMNMSKMNVEPNLVIEDGQEIRDKAKIASTMNK